MIPEVDAGLVVIVEDPFIRRFLRSVLTRAGHRSVELGPQQGVELVRAGEVHIKAVITNCPETFRCCGAEFPLIYTTSCPDPEVLKGFPRCRVLQKPFDGSQLLQALNEVGDRVIA